MKPGALIITFPRAWDIARRLEFMADVAPAMPRTRWVSVAEAERTVEIAASAEERRAAFSRLSERRARGVDEHPVSMIEVTE